MIRCGARTLPKRFENMTYLHVFDAVVSSQPGCDERTMLLCPMLVELIFAEIEVASCAHCDAYELVCRHGCGGKQLRLVTRQDSLYCELAADDRLHEIFDGAARLQLSSQVMTSLSDFGTCDEQSNACGR
jgi:hypothetical protein